jgi:two-component system, chemotaxis family, protein-glutamate methylesterase/glutaminase
MASSWSCSIRAASSNSRADRLSGPIRVLVVDDSRLFRTAVAESLAGESDLQVVGSERNGLKAIEFLKANPTVDVVTLDLEMPEMDGLQALRAIRDLNHGREHEIGVIMLSAHTTQGAQSTITALSTGAFDFITKPTSESPAESIASLKRQLPARIRAFATRFRRAPLVVRAPTLPALTPPPRPLSPVTRTGSAQAILIGVSTGGPKALLTMLPRLTQLIRLPIIIVQHMPPKFTASLAESLGRVCAHQVHEATDGQAIEPGNVYIAPGGQHLVVRRQVSGAIVCGVNDNPPENGLRPNVDVMFRSAAQVWGGHVVAVILTGMGSDGAKGLAPLKRAGAPVVVQDEATSIVWGMPGAAVAAGLADQILPLEAIPDAIARAAR